MNSSAFSEASSATKHKLFVSYYHREDQSWRNSFERLFGDLFINKSVKPGDIDADLSDDYIKKLIQQGYISDMSVLVVLVGPKTYCRKHVDWEISAGLMKKVGGHSGLMGLFLPSHPDYRRDKYNADIVPARLVDNRKSEYASLYDWTEDRGDIKKWVESAFKSRIHDAHKINNSRKQLSGDKCQ